jgi:hypothetical protein
LSSRPTRDHSAPASRKTMISHWPFSYRKKKKTSNDKPTNAAGENRN